VVEAFFPVQKLRPDDRYSCRAVQIWATLYTGVVAGRAIPAFLTPAAHKRQTSSLTHCVSKELGQCKGLCISEGQTSDWFSLLHYQIRNSIERHFPCSYQPKPSLFFFVNISINWWHDFIAIARELWTDVHHAWSCLCECDVK
jgi:hypothetical protein